MKMILNCLVLGSTSNMFPVIIADVIRFNDALVSIDEFSVGLLKIHIWKEIDDGSGIEPQDLDLWKVEIPECKENKKILKNPEISCIEQVFGSEKLNPNDMFLKKGVFPDTYTPPHSNIHVIIIHPLLVSVSQCFTSQIRKSSVISLILLYSIREKKIRFR